MIRCLAVLLVLGLAALESGAVGQERPGDEEPVRLRKKKKIIPEGPIEPEKPANKEKPKIDGKPKEEEKGKPGQDNESSDDEAEEREVLDRIARNVKVAEERLANRELNESTRQVQEDALKDLDTLIKKASQPPQSGGADQSSGSDSAQGEQAKSGSKKGGSARSSGSRRSPQSAGQGRQRGQRNQARGGGQPKQKSQGSSKGTQPNEGASARAGNTPRQGGKGSEGKPNRAADLYKDIWGHLPESVRAEMDTYVNNRQFMAKYDDLIKRYYSAIAEKGRTKAR